MASRNNFFNRGLRLVADYQFNNNLIDDVTGESLDGINVAYNNNRLVLNGVNTKVNKFDSGISNRFSFTDSVKDLPFKIEMSVQFDEFNRIQFLVDKRDEGITGCEWQINFNNTSNSIDVILFSGGINTDRILKGCVITPNVNTIYDIVATYDGNGLDGLNINVNGVDGTLADEVGTYVGMTKSAQRFYVGSWKFVGSNILKGKIDYLKIYK